MASEQKFLLDEEKQQQFAGMILLDRMIAGEARVHASLMDNDDKLLEKYLNVMESKGLIGVGEDNYYMVTEAGKQLYQKLLDQQVSYATHFDIYSHVNLSEGTFADKESDFLEDDCWADLRVAVAIFKGIDPYRMVFLAMLSDESFFQNPDWKFDMAMGTLFEELEDIVRSQITEDELSYEDEEGTVSGYSVLEDVIQQGAAINQERYQKQQEQERELEKYTEQPEQETVTIIQNGGYGYGYDPMMTLGAYAASALFIEAIWHDPYW
ncbi:MAG: hypothetical protein HQM14_13160 [SAR324 cluster bacterium]|nr:hypothetical protein [SAR324 cluster bacterium]